MHKIAALKINKGFLWRTAVSCLLLFDYFLFATGNPSITYSILGGWFEVTLVAAAVVAVSYGYEVSKGREAKQRFVLYLIAVGLFSLVLLMTSTYARDLANAHLQAEIGSFISDPIGSKADVSNDERQLMVELKGQKYSVEREAFIPTFRRMDYLFETETGEKYRLVITMGWNGTPRISLRRIDT